MRSNLRVSGFLHFRTDLGEGIRSGVILEHCRERCHSCCCPASFFTKSLFDEASDKTLYSPEELIAYLKEERTLYDSKPLGINLMGSEPLRMPHYCLQIAAALKKDNVSLHIHTCALCEAEVFSMLWPYVDLFVLNLFCITDKRFKPFPDYPVSDVINNILYLDNEKIPYRICVKVLSHTSKNELYRIAAFLKKRSSLKSIILDFSASQMDLEAQREIRHLFLEKGIIIFD